LEERTEDRSIFEMAAMQPEFKKIIIVYHRFPPIAEDLKKAFLRKGINAEIFYTTDFEHWFYRRIIKTVNRYARSLRLIPKGGDIFKSHPLNRANSVASHFQKIYAQYQPDAVLVIHGLPFGEQFLSAITTPKIGWHLEPRDDLPYLIENANPFGIYNSYSQKDVGLLVGAGFDCRYLSHAVDSGNFFTTVGAEKKYDITFVGNWSAWRDETVRAALEVTPNVALYGGFWEKKSKIAKRVFNRIYKGKEIVGAELNRLFNESKIVLNASRTPGSFGLNMRFFEVLASGALLLTDAAPELKTHFVPDTHLVLYRDLGELKLRLSELLNNRDELERIRCAGQQLVLDHNRYDQMATHLLKQFLEIAERPEARAV
jgi:glycosyltransferase involved in cell wall biosynthesis